MCIRDSLNAMSATEDRLLRAFEVVTPSVASTVASTITSENSVNSASQDAVSLEVLKLLKEIQGSLCTSTSSGRNQQQRTGRDTVTNRLDKSKYCWSHGAWNHTGKRCKSEKPGHKEDATFTNKMGGSTDSCST